MGNDVVVPTRTVGTIALLDEMVPAIVTAAGARAARRWVEFFTAELTNDNTRLAYARATGEFFDWLAETAGLGDGEQDLRAITTTHVAAYRELLTKMPAQSKGKGGVLVEKRRSVTTVKLKLAAIRSLFRYLKEGGAIDEDPAASVRAPKHSVRIGKTAVLQGNEAARILDTLTAAVEKNPDDVVALRDRALIALMTFTLARVSAAVGMTVSDVKMVGNRRHVELREKGGKQHVMPCHHELEDYLVGYIATAKLSASPALPLFRAVDNGQRKVRRQQAAANVVGDELISILGPEPLSRMKAWEMVQRRAKEAGVSTAACNHTFRATGITTFLENGGAIEKARDMAAHASIRTTQLYDRRNKAVKMDDVVLINLRAVRKDGG